MARSFTFRLSSEGVQELQRQLEGLGEAGTQAFNKIKAASPQLRDALDAAGQKTDEVRRRFEGMATNDNVTRGLAGRQNQIRQVGYQVQDLAIQLQAGQNAFMAFSQQGGQLAQSLLGPQAALVATVALIGAMIGKQFLFTESTTGATDAWRAWGKETEAATELQKKLNEALDEGNNLLLTSAERTERDTAHKRARARAAAFEAIEQERRNIADMAARVRQLQTTAARDGSRVQDLVGRIDAARQQIDDLFALLDRLDEVETKGGAAREKAAKDAAAAEKERARFIEKINRDIDAAIAAETKRNVSVEKYIAGLEAAASQEALSTTEKEVQRALLEAQNRLIDEQGEKLRDLTEEERRRIRAAVETREAREAARRKAEEAAKEYAREYEKAVDRATENAADLLFDAFEGKIGDIGELLERTLKRAIAEALAQDVIRPLLIQPIVGAFMGGAPGAAGAAGATGAGAGLGVLSSGNLSAVLSGGGGLGVMGSAAGVGAGLLFGFQSQALGSFLANTALEAGLSSGVAGFLGNAGLNLGYGSIGSLAAGLMGLGSGNMLVDTGLGTAGAFLGGGIGASITALGAAGGPIGAAVGAFLGTAAGGLFGGGGGFRNGALTEGFTGVQNGRLVVTGVGATNGGDLGAGRQFAQGGADFVNALVAADVLSLAGTGVRFDTKFGNFRTFTGPTPNNADTPAGGFLGVGTDAQAVLIDTVRNMVARGFASVDSPEVRTAIAHSAARAIEDFVSDLDFAAALSSIDLDPEPLTQYEQAVKRITDGFQEAADRARALGLAEETLIAARDRALTDLNEGVKQALEDQILALTNPLELAIRELERAQAVRLDEAVAAGVDLAKIEHLNALERQRVLQQFSGNLSGFLDELTFGAVSGAAPGATLSGQRLAFEQAAAAALGGDVTARGRVEQLGRSLLETSRAFSASGAGFQGDLDLVRGVVAQLVPANDNGSVVAAINSNGAAQIDLLAEMVEQLAQTNARLASVESENKRLTRLLERVVA